MTVGDGKRRLSLYTGSSEGRRYDEHGNSAIRRADDA